MAVKAAATSGDAVQYEIAILFDPGLEVDMEKASGRVEKIFKDNGGKVTGVDNWGKRALAYPIKKHEHAIYVFYTVGLPPESVQKIEAALNITDETIRFLITRLDPKAIAKAEKAKAEKAKKIAQRNEANENKDTEKEKDE